MLDKPATIFGGSSSAVDLFDVIKSCLRRWYVVLPILILTAGLAYWQYSSVKLVYYANGVVGISPPNEYIQFAGEGKPAPRNGLLEVGGADLITNMTVLSMTDASVRSEIVAQGGRPDYTIRMFPAPLTGAGSQLQIPLIMVEATEADAASAERTVNLAAAKAGAVMEDLQRKSGVPESLIVRGLVISPPSAIAGPPSRLKPVLLRIIAGTGIAVLSAVLLDLYLARRKRATPAGSPSTAWLASGNDGLRETRPSRPGETPAAMESRRR